MSLPSKGQTNLGGEGRIENMGGRGRTCRIAAVAGGSAPDDGRFVAHAFGRQHGGPFGDAKPLAEDSTDATSVETRPESHSLTRLRAAKAALFLLLLRYNNQWIDEMFTESKNFCATNSTDIQGGDEVVATG